MIPLRSFLKLIQMEPSYFFLLVRQKRIFFPKIKKHKIYMTKQEALEFCKMVGLFDHKIKSDLSYYFDTSFKKTTKKH